VQLASNAGATVIAIASGDDEAYLNSIGASRVIDYREAQFEKVLRDKVDVVFDLIGGDTQKRSFLVLKEGGYLVSAVQPVSQEETVRHRVSGAMMRLAPSGEVLGRIARLLEERTIRPDVATVYALQDVAQAWKEIAENLPGVHGISPTGQGTARHRSHGKIVLHLLAPSAFENPWKYRYQARRAAKTRQPVCGTVTPSPSPLRRYETSVSSPHFRDTRRHWGPSY
jgi:Zinc-binding dehydrogenase